MAPGDVTRGCTKGNLEEAGQRNEESVWSEMLQGLDHPNIVGPIPQLFSMMRLHGRVLVCTLTCLVIFL
jgi:hypothetical protein